MKLERVISMVGTALSVVIVLFFCLVGFGLFCRVLFEVWNIGFSAPIRL